MSSSRPFLVWILLLIPTLVPAFVLGYILRGEGPLWIPLLWALVSLALAVWDAAYPGTHRLIRAVLLIWIGLGLVIILLFLNVSRRSLAEVWFIMVRRGRARGFFSYFATLVYGFLTTLSSILMLQYGILAGILSIGLVSCMVWAILFSQTAGFFAALGLALALFIIINSKGFSLLHGKELVVMVLSVSLLFGSVLLCLMPVIPLCNGTGTEVRLPGIDMTPLVLRIAPTLPLLLDVPGYGLDVGGSRFSNRLDLSSVPLFEIQGPPNKSMYLASATYQDRTSEGWAEDIYAHEPKLLNENLQRSGLLVLWLRFVGDYYDRFPLPASTSSIALQPWAPQASLPPVHMAGLQSGIRFTSPIEQGTGLEIRLSQRPENSQKGLELGIQTGDPSAYQHPGPDPGGRLAQLVRQLKVDFFKNATPLAIALTLDTYLKEQYRYAPRVQGGPSALALERFLFEEKQGYCLHFASAFVVILRLLGIPARIVEGFRVTLDDQGRGLVRGTDAHAWAEAYIDGLWLRFDPTPSAAAAAAPAGDARRLAGNHSAAPYRPGLTGGSGRNSGQSATEGPTVWPLIVFPLLIALLLGALYRLCLSMDQSRYRKSCLRHYVRLGKRRGIPGPDMIGWLRWQKIAADASIVKNFAELEDLIHEHLRYSFGKDLANSNENPDSSPWA